MKINMILKFYTRNWTQNKYATLLKLRIVELVYNLYWICYAKQERSLDVIKMSPLNPSQKLFSISCWILIYISTTHSSNWRYFMFLFILYLTVLKKAMRKSNTDIWLHRFLDLSTFCLFLLFYAQQVRSTGYTILTSKIN